MNRRRHRFLAAVILFAIAFTGCGERAATSDNDPVTTTETTATTSAEVALEPAYPADVSNEPLTEEDKAQQQTHRHGDGEEHSHDAETKTDAGHSH